MTISVEDRAKLISLARGAVTAEVSNQLSPTVESSSGIFSEQRGCFVTLTNSGMLRGCIGTFSPSLPLGKMIVEMGRSAARDPRFLDNPITADELEHLTVEVSVLSPLEKTDNPEALEIGTDGIYIVQGARSGCFLPEVATDQGWNAEEFLGYCCSHKAGLSHNAWRDPETTVYLFSSEKFEE
jgi:uncharacterized protein